MNLNKCIQDFILMIGSWRFWKSIFSGVITAVVDLMLLFYFHKILGWSSLWAVNVSFAFAVVVNFSLQKFWTFSSKDLALTHKQFSKFLMVSGVNFIMNGFIMFFFVSVLGLWYLGAQVVVMGLLTMMNFILYRNFVFM